jgi:hypothetical protein
LPTKVFRRSLKLTGQNLWFKCQSRPAAGQKHTQSYYNNNKPNDKVELHIK